MKFRFSSLIVDLIVFAFGLLSLLAIFIFPEAGSSNINSSAFPIMVSLIILLSLIILFFEAQISQLNSKMIAFLGVLIAINAGIRFLENAFPGPAGFSPTFFLIILTGYSFGAKAGFIMGAMTMFVSGLITGGVGPWLPGQMVTAGWVGQSSAFLSILIRQLGRKNGIFELVILALFGAIWGILFGLIMNLWFWPFLGAPSGQSWLQSAGIMNNLQRYLAYYLATSLVWDITRAIGNILIITTMARPVLKIFQRFHLRFSFSQAEQEGLY